MYITRREAISLATAVLCRPVAAIAQKSSADKLDPYFDRPVVYRHFVPRELQPTDILAVVNSLTTDRKLPPADYLSKFVDWVQYIHHGLSGMTYPGHMENAYGFKSPIEILVADNLQVGGTFRPETPEIRRNLAYVNSSLNPRTLIRILTHELEHSVHGRSELFAHANTLMEFAYMFAHFPELLGADDSKCLFCDTLNFYAGKANVEPDNIEFSEESLPTMFLFGSLEDSGHTLGLKAAFSRLAEDSGLEPKIDGFIQKLTRIKSFATMIDARHSFLNEVERYILEENSSMPPDKVELIKGKVDRIRQGQR